MYILGANKSLKLSVVKGKTGKKRKKKAVPVHGPIEAQIYSPTRWSALTPQPTCALGKEQPVPIEQGLGRARSLSRRFEQHNPLVPAENRHAIRPMPCPLLSQYTDYAIPKFRKYQLSLGSGILPPLLPPLTHHNTIHTSTPTNTT